MARSIDEVSALLTEARQAYHDLVTGSKPMVVIDGNNGDQVRYTPANTQKLYAYINQLQSELDMLTGLTRAPSNTPARFIF